MLVGNVFNVLLVFLKEIMKPYEVPQLVNCDSEKAQSRKSVSYVM